MKRILSLLFIVTNLVYAEATVRLGEVSDKRTTGEFFTGLEIKLLVNGPGLAEAKGMRVKLDRAADDTGKSLVTANKFGRSSDEFKPLEAPFGSRPKAAGEFETSVELANPPRNAKTVALVGKVELISPKMDPSSIVTASLATAAGKPLNEPAIKAAGVEITLKAAKDDELGYDLKDPGGKVASVEFCGADGMPLKTSGSSSMGSGTTKSVTISVPNAPVGVTVKIYLITAKSLVSLPFKLDVPLP